MTRALNTLESLHLPGTGVDSESIITETESKYRDEAQKFRKSSIVNLQNLVKVKFELI